jgi:hypothetical protein
LSGVCGQNILFWNIRLSDIASEQKDNFGKRFMELFPCLSNGPVPAGQRKLNSEGKEEVKKEQNISNEMNGMEKSKWGHRRS